VHRRADHDDRRASILDLTEEGHVVLQHTRAYRRERLEQILDEWSDQDLGEFARLLTKANDSISNVVEKVRVGEAQKGA
jgi:DNA-binding MarR family transcriptional regulator